LKVYLQDAYLTVLQAADIYLAMYPEDLLPHPATFYDALANGCAMLTTSSKAALSHLPQDAGRITWSTAPELVSREMFAMLDNPVVLAGMQTAAWQASRSFSWQRSAYSLLGAVLAPLLVT
jgi:hypothetical protein